MSRPPLQRYKEPDFFNLKYIPQYRLYIDDGILTQIARNVLRMNKNMFFFRLFYNLSEPIIETCSTNEGGYSLHHRLDIDLTLIQPSCIKSTSEFCFSYPYIIANLYLNQTQEYYWYLHVYFSAQSGFSQDLALSRLITKSQIIIPRAPWFLGAWQDISHTSDDLP